MARYTKWALPDDDCHGRLGGLTIKIYYINSPNPTVEYNLSEEQVPDAVRVAVTGWIKNSKFGGLSLSEYLNRMFNAKDFE